MFILIITALIILVICFTLLSNYIRHSYSYKFELKPNCLLTRHPILFVSGYKTIFYFLNYWNSTPFYLRQHGYNVSELNLNWKSKTQRENEIKKFLEANPQTQFHIILEEQTLNDFSALDVENIEQIKNIWVLGAEKSLENKISLKDLKRNTKIKYYELQTKNKSAKKEALSFNRLILKISLWIHNFSLSFNKKGCLKVLGVPFINNIDDISREYLKLAVNIAEYDLK